MKRGRDDAAASTAPTTKKTTLHGDDHALATDISALPTSALSLVWSFAVSMKISDDVCANGEHQLFQMNVHDLQLVCRSWRETMQEMLQEKLRGVAVVDVVAATKAHGKATTALVPVLESFDKTSPVTDVRVQMGDLISGQDVNDRGIWSDDEQALIAVRVQRDFVFHKTQPDIDWEAALAPHGATITRLDLSHMLLYSRHLGDLLRAAAKLCPNVKALLLPPAEKKMYRNEDVRTKNMDALSVAMRAWHKSNGGLTHLRVPFVGLNNLVSSVLLVNDVTLYCPDIEHLDGWRFTFIEQANLEFVTCDEFWLSPPELFAQLWEKCTKLKSFNSVVLPFGDEYYGELAEVDKPQLEDLVLSYNSLTSNPSEEMDAELFESITERMPALRTLSLMFGETGEESDWAASDVFGDTFFLAVVQNCLKLKKLSVKSFSPLELFSAGGLEALLTMPQLNDISIRSMAELDERFLTALTERMKTKRALRMRLTVTRMRDMIWKVLALVAEMKTEAFDGVSLSLSLSTKEAFGFALVEGDDENGRLHEMEQVKELVETITRTHGKTVRVHLHTTLPSDEHDSKCVQFDSLELSINDPQGFCCTRNKFTEVGHEDIEQELCGDDVRADGVFARDAAGVREDVEYVTYRMQRRPRRVFYPDLLSDEDDDDEDGEFGGGAGEFDEEFDDDDELVFAGADDDGEDDDDDDDDDGTIDDEDDDDEDVDDIFGGGEEDDDEE